MPAAEGAILGHGGGGRQRQGDGLSLPPGGGGAAAAADGAGPRGGQVVSGVSTLVDLPLPNNGDYSREWCEGIGVHFCAWACVLVLFVRILTALAVQLLSLAAAETHRLRIGT